MSSTRSSTKIIITYSKPLTTSVTIISNERHSASKAKALHRHWPESKEPSTKYISGYHQLCRDALTRPQKRPPFDPYKDLKVEGVTAIKKEEPHSPHNIERPLTTKHQTKPHHLTRPVTVVTRKRRDGLQIGGWRGNDDHQTRLTCRCV